MRTLQLAALGLLALTQPGLAAPAVRDGAAGAAQVVVLTQLPCQIVESEDGIDRGYRSQKQADCERINAQSAAARVLSAKPLELKPGRTVFRVTNKSVPYELGFWLRGAGLAGRATLPSVSGGGLVQGVTQDYEIVLQPGEYLYSCPLNTTPDYRLIVKK